MEATCRWGQFTFDIYDLSDDDWNEIAGLYIFAYSLEPGRWRAVYIGETGSFRTRMANHERREEAVQAGATHIHAMTFVGDDDARKNLEQDLILEFSPLIQER